MDIEFIGKDILDCAYAIHSRFGSGLLEKAYRVILATELRRLGHEVEEEKVCGFSYNGQDYKNMSINFGMSSLKDCVERVVNNTPKNFAAFA